MSGLHEEEIAALRAKLAEDERRIAQLEEAIIEQSHAIKQTLEDAMTMTRDAAAMVKRYRAALAQYATWANWQPCPSWPRDKPMEMREWIGGGEGPSLAERALAGGEK